MIQTRSRIGLKCYRCSQLRGLGGGGQFAHGHISKGIFYTSDSQPGSHFTQCRLSLAQHGITDCDTV
ncbi:hypothetical protein FKM82_004624 [Ascaphus truei]